MCHNKPIRHQSRAPALSKSYHVWFFVLLLLLLTAENTVTAKASVNSRLGNAPFSPFRLGWQSALSRYPQTKGAASALSSWRKSKSRTLSVSSVNHHPSSTCSTRLDIAANGDEIKYMVGDTQDDDDERRVATAFLHVDAKDKSSSLRSSYHGASFPVDIRRQQIAGQTSIEPTQEVSMAKLCSQKVARVKSPSAMTGGAVASPRTLLFWETMVCGAVSRSVAQTIMHPANTMKTILQNSKGPMIPTILGLCKPSSFHRLTYGAGTNFLLSMPNGALNFSVLELVRRQLGIFVASHPSLEKRAESLGAVLDFTSSALSTVVCSVVATPQMMITDNIMVGNYPNLPKAVSGLYQSGGIPAFYRGWLPGIVGKIPSYALTWTLFQQLKELRNRISDRPATNVENSIMGATASTINVCIMIPLDTIKTRLVVQGGAESISKVPYKGIIDCAYRVAREEGIGAFYRGLPPRLVSVVPMIAIQFAVYEAVKKLFLQRPDPSTHNRKVGRVAPAKMKLSNKRDAPADPSSIPEPVTIFEDVEEVSMSDAAHLKVARFPTLRKS